MGAWRDEYYLKAAEMAREGHDDASIARGLGVSKSVFCKWKSQRPALIDAIDRGRREGGFRDYIYACLPEHLKNLVDDLDRCTKLPNGRERAEALLEKHGETARKRLYVHFLMNSHFDATRACARCHISLREYQRWMDEDPDFRSLIHEIPIHQNNFIRGNFYRRIEEGDSNLLKLAVISRLADEGFQDKKTKEITGQVNHQHLHAHARIKAREILERLPPEKRREAVLLAKLLHQKQGEGLNGEEGRRSETDAQTAAQGGTLRDGPHEQGQQQEALHGPGDPQPRLPDPQPEGRSGTNVEQGRESVHPE